MDEVNRTIQKKRNQRRRIITKLIISLSGAVLIVAHELSLNELEDINNEMKKEGKNEKYSN